jgi:hypothetical protein
LDRACRTPPWRAPEAACRDQHPGAALMSFAPATNRQSAVRNRRHGSGSLCQLADAWLFTGDGLAAGGRGDEVEGARGGRCHKHPPRLAMMKARTFSFLLRKGLALSCKRLACATIQPSAEADHIKVSAHITRRCLARSATAPTSRNGVPLNEFSDPEMPAGSVDGRLRWMIEPYGWRWSAIGMRRT